MRGRKCKMSSANFLCSRFHLGDTHPTPFLWRPSPPKLTVFFTIPSHPAINTPSPTCTYIINHSMGSTQWDSHSEAALVECLLGIRASGRSSDSGLKAGVWREVADHLNKLFNTTSFDSGACKSKNSVLKSKFNLFTKVRSNSGFGWDEAKSLPTAPTDVWERLYEAHPTLRKHKFDKVVFALYDKLQLLYEGTQAEGKWALHTVPMDSSSQGSNVGERSAVGATYPSTTPNPASTASPATPSMAAPATNETSLNTSDISPLPLVYKRQRRAGGLGQHDGTAAAFVRAYEARTAQLESIQAAPKTSLQKAIAVAKGRSKLPLLQCTTAFMANPKLAEAYIFLDDEDAEDLLLSCI